MSFAQEVSAETLLEQYSSKEGYLSLNLND